MRLKLWVLLYICLNCQGVSEQKQQSTNIERNSGFPLTSGRNVSRLLRDSAEVVVSYKEATNNKKNKLVSIIDTSSHSVVDSILKVGFPVENSLPADYVKNGTVDYTKYLQEAINAHKILVFPGFPILVNDSGLRIPSDRKILFSQGSKLLLKPSDRGSYQILHIRKAKNILLYNPVITGDRYQHKGKEGEWGMGISIYSSRNVRIYNADIRNCWGDGIYISQIKSLPPPEDITIVNAHCYKNRRNGITIISGSNIQLIDPILEYSDGIGPKAGIDIEPNQPYNELKNIIIQNAITKFNPGKGIQIGLGGLIREGMKHVSIKIENHKDVGSKIACVLACNPVAIKESFRGRADRDTAFNGYIKILNPVWKNNITPIKAKGFRTNKISLQVAKPVIINADNQKVNAITIRNMIKKAVGPGGVVNIQD